MLNLCLRKQQSQVERGLQNMTDDVKAQNDASQAIIVEHVQKSQAWQRQVLRVIRSAPNAETLPLQEEKKKKFARDILELLFFATIAIREERIPEAYQNTFAWIFTHLREQDQRPGADFVDWLRNESALYWITGKAGAGKSTLMKLICGDPRTFQILEKSASACGRKIAFARYFFWNSGVKLQMTQEGLLRTLLYQLVHEFDELAVTSFPERWEYYNRFEMYDTESMGLHELQKAIGALMRTNLDKRFVLLIDGLDEFVGDHADLVAFIQELSENTNVKICVSSRPWNVFEDAFKRGPSLRLEYLTYPDFVYFVESNFSRSEGFAELQEEGKDEAENLMRAIAEKASGVFLWVNLVVRSLLSGMRDGERLSDLHRRLDELPDELEHLFQKMMDGIEPEKKQHASQLFQIVRAAKEPLTVICLAWADEEDPKLPFQRPIMRMSAKERDAKARRMRRRLNSYCHGLLEAHSVSLAEGSVEYIHRTVRDFLYRPETWESLVSMTEKPFSPKLALCNAYLLQLKCAEPPELSHRDYEGALNKGCLSTLLPWFVQYADDVYDQHPHSVLELFDELAKTIQGLVNPGSKCTAKSCWCRGPSDHSDGPFLAFAVSLQIRPYVRYRLKQRPIEKQHKGAMSLLQTAITDFQTYHGKNETLLPACCHSDPDPSLIRLLLEYGADPNFSPDHKTRSPWQAALTSRTQWLPEVFRAFLWHGADPWVNLNFLNGCSHCGESLKQYVLVLELQRERRKKSTRWWYRLRTPEERVSADRFRYKCAFCSGTSWLAGAQS